MTFDDFKRAHDNSDADNSPTAQHHTLGKGPTQAASGNHNHSGQYAVIDHTHVSGTVGEVIMYLGSNPPTTEYLLLNGQSIQRVDYPVLFSVLGVPVGTDLTYLPDYRDRFPVGASGTKPRNTTGGSSTVTLTEANLPSHAHSINHTHPLDHTHADDKKYIANTDPVQSGAGATAVTSITESANSLTITAPTASQSTGNSGNGNGTAAPVGLPVPPWVSINFFVKAM